MTKTENYQLNQWDAADPFRREDFNADNAKLDAALAALQQTAESKADAEDVAALAAGLGSGGANARIAFGTYTGDGTCGSTAPTSLSVDFIPILVLVEDETASKTKASATFMRSMTTGYNGLGSLVYLTWGDTGLSWYYDTSTVVSAAAQMNAAGEVYHYTVLGYSAAV